MVNLRFATAFLTLVLLTPGCAKFWGEAPPPPGRVQLASSGNGCGGVEEILDADEIRSKQVFECWASEVQKVFDQVDGQIPESLSVAELQTLVDRGVVEFGASKSDVKGKIASAYEFFGIGERITRDRMGEWLAFARENRILVRRLYRKFVAPGALEVIFGADDARDAIGALSAFVRTARWDAGLKFENLLLDLNDLSKLSERANSIFRSGARLAILDGENFSRGLLERLDWALAKCDEIIFARDWLSSDLTQAEAMSEASVSRVLSFSQALVFALESWGSKLTLNALLNELEIWAPPSESDKQRINSAARLLLLDGPDFIPALRARMDWTQEHLGSLLRARDLLASDFAPSPGSRRRRINEADALQLTGTLNEAVSALRKWGSTLNLNTLLNEAENFSSVSDNVRQKSRAAAELLTLDGPDFLAALEERVSWARERVGVLFHAYDVLTLESSAPRVSDAEIPALTSTLREVLASLAWDDSLIGFPWVRERLGVLMGLSETTFQQLDGWARFLGLDAHYFRPLLLSRVDWILARSDEVRYFYRSLVLEKKKLNDLGMERFFAFGRSFLDSVRWNSGFGIAAFNQTIELIFDLSSENIKQLRASERVTGLSERLPPDAGDIRILLRERLDFMARNWNDFQLLSKRLAPGVLFQGDRGKKDLDLLNSFLHLTRSGDRLDSRAFLDSLSELCEISAQERGQIEAVWDILSVGGVDFHDKIAARVRYLADHFEDLKWMYEKYLTGFQPFRYTELQKALTIFAQFLGELGWSFTPERLASIVTILFSIQDKDVLRAAEPFSRALLNGLGFLCPDVSSLTLWQSHEISTCLVKVPKAFAAGGNWADFHFNPPLGVPSKDRIAKVKKSLVALDVAASSWFNQSKLKPIRTKVLVDLAQAFGARPPRDFIDSLGIIEKFGSKSNRNAIHPTAAAYLAHVYRDFRSDVLDGLPVFVRALASHRCRDPRASTYEDCAPIELDHENVAIRIALQGKNLQFAADVAPFDGRRFTKLMLFRALAGQLLHVFDTDRDGIVVSINRKEPNEVMEMMSASVAAYDTVSRFANNIVLKLKGKPIVEGGPPVSFNQFDLRGLSRVVTLFATDLLVSRPKDEREDLMKSLGKLLKGLRDVAPQSASFLDRQGIMAAIDLVDTLGALREDFVRGIDPSLHARMVDDSLGAQVRVRRSEALDELPDFLRRNFPRSYESCRQWGFDKSCGSILSEILAAPDSQGMISSGDLDAVSLFVVGLESLVDSCDENGDARLELGTFWSQDELSCAIKKGVDVIERLIDAKVMRTNSNSSISTALSLIKLHDLTRSFAKTALIDGTSRWILLTPARIPVEIIKAAVLRRKGFATMGSVYSLTSSLAD